MFGWLFGDYKEGDTKTITQECSSCDGKGYEDTMEAIYGCSSCGGAGSADDRKRFRKGSGKERVVVRLQNGEWVLDHRVK